MDILDELTCPVCMRGFRSKKGCASHLKSAHSCSWYRRGKLAELAKLDLEGEGGDMQIMDQGEEMAGEEIAEKDPEVIMDDVEDDLFDFIPMPTPAIGEQGPGPSTMAAYRRLLHQVLDDDDNMRVEDIFEGAGKVIRMKESIHEKWRHLFRKEKDTDGDQLMEEETSGGDAFYPF